MKRNIFRRSRVKEQINTVSKLFAEYDIDLSLVTAGRTLYQSLAQAKMRTKKRKDYIKKGIMFMFSSKDRLALIEVIQGDKAFWEAWVKQNVVYERTGLESDKPTIHRINPDGHYEFGNIAVLPYGEHQQEHAKPVVVLDTKAIQLTTYKTQTEFKKMEGVTQSQMTKINKAFEVDSHFQQRKENTRKELADRNREFCEKHGITYKPI